MSATVQGASHPKAAPWNAASCPLDPVPLHGSTAIDALTVTGDQMFDLVSAQSRIVLGRTARNVQEKLNHVYAAVGTFFVARCPSVQELLHPQMT